MRYRPEIFALYDDLFKEAHESLIKEAGVFSRAGGAIRKGLTKINPWAGRANLRQGNEALAQQTSKARQQAVKARQRLGEEQAAHEATREAQPALISKAVDDATLAARERASGMGRLAAGAGAAGVLGTGGAYLYGRHGAEEERKRTRNLSFGAGAAAGLAAPTIIRGLGNIASGAGQTGLFPELQGYEGVNPNAYLGGGG